MPPEPNPTMQYKLSRAESIMVCVPYFYRKWNQHEADEEYGDFAFFKVTPDEVERFIELAGVYGVYMSEAATGVVGVTTFETEARYDCAVAEIERQLDEDDS